MSQYIYIDEKENMRVINLDDFRFIKEERYEKRGLYDPTIKRVVKLGDNIEESKKFVVRTMMPHLVRIR